MTALAGRFLRDTRDAIVVLRLLVLAGLAMLGLSARPEHPGPFWSTIIAYGLTNLLYMTSGATRFLSSRTRVVVFAVDVLVVSSLIILRGAQVPQFILAYFTLVLMAAVVQGIGSAALNAVVVCTVFAAVSLWGAEPKRLLEFPTLAQFAFFFVVSVFMSQVAEWGREQARERARSDEERRRLAGVIEDRTRDLSRSVEELEAARRRLAAADRLATIGMLAAGVAHDIRNPVAALRAALDEARTVLAEPTETSVPSVTDEPSVLLASAVEDAFDACESLNRLASDLTAVARATPAPPVPVACLDALSGAARLLRHRARPPLSLEVRCTTEASALADPGRLQQVLLNLGSNALDAMEGREGTVTLGAEDGRAGFVRFRVEDTGIGMSSSTAARILEGFFTTKDAGKGTGLGLHLVREIVEAHGARIQIESTPGSGTTVLIDWPTAPPGRPNGDDDHERVEAGAADRGRRGEHPSRADANASA